MRTVLGFKRFHFSTVIYTAVEKILSDDTQVAGILR